MAVAALSNIKMSMDSTIKVAACTEFNATPDVGELCFKDGILWIFSQASGGALTWYPLTNIENTYTHSQSTPTTIWNINHKRCTGPILGHHPLDQTISFSEPTLMVPTSRRLFRVLVFHGVLP